MGLATPEAMGQSCFAGMQRRSPAQEAAAMAPAQLKQKQLQLQQQEGFSEAATTATSEAATTTESDSPGPSVAIERKASARAEVATPEKEKAEKDSGLLSEHSVAATAEFATPEKEKAEKAGRHATDSESSAEDDGVLFPPAALGPDGLPSRGSVGHAEGECKRCCFFPKGRCGNGHDCNFCHFDHDRRKRLKKKKKRGTADVHTPTPSSVAGPMHSPSYRNPLLTPGGAAAHTNGSQSLNMVATPQSAVHGHTFSAPAMPPMSPTALAPGPPSPARLSLGGTPPQPGAAPGNGVAGFATGSVAVPADGGAEPSITIMPSLLATTVGNAPVAPIPSGTPPPLPAGGKGEMAASAQLGLLIDPTSMVPAAAAQQRAPAPWSNAPCEDGGLGGTVPWSLGYGSAYRSAGPPDWLNSDLGSAAYPTNPYAAGAATMQGRVPMVPWLQPPSAAGMDKDSPRSALLTLCGAWGALATKKGVDNQAADETPIPPCIGRSELLAFHDAAKGGARPAALMSLRVMKAR